ncbi:MAG: tetratricopeptide repeat protein [Mesorhizobium sp.]
MGDPKLQNQMRRIVADFNAGHHEQARLLCEEGLRRTPDDPALNHLLAAVLYAKGEVTEARACVLASLTIRADNAAAQLLAGRIARAARDFDRALFHLSRAQELAPGVAVVLERARTLDEAGDRNQAREAWRQVTVADPLSAEAAARLGRMLFEDGMPTEAAPLLERAVKGDAPASAWFDLALVRQDLHDHEGAAAAYRKALEKHPDDAEAAVNLGVTLQETGDIDAAIEAYRTAYQQRATTFGTIAMALTSAPHGRLWLDRETLKELLSGQIASF